MEYKGKLYGKVGKHYFPLVMTSDDVDELLAIRDRKPSIPTREMPSDEEINKFVKSFGNYYMDTKNTFEQCVDYFKIWIKINLNY